MNIRNVAVLKLLNTSELGSIYLNMINKYVSAILIFDDNKMLVQIWFSKLMQVLCICVLSIYVFHYAR
jgi:hypothetical protein